MTEKVEETGARPGATEAPATDQPTDQPTEKLREIRAKLDPSSNVEARLIDVIDVLIG